MAIAGVTHHIVLDDGVTKIGLIACDGAGQPTFSGWRRTPLTRTSVKTSSGVQRYSDLEPPYHTIAQDNWEGGRGQEDLLSDNSRFYDSQQVWTQTKGQVILAPRQTPSILPFEVSSDVIHVPDPGESITSLILRGPQGTWEQKPTIQPAGFWAQKFFAPPAAAVLKSVRLLLSRHPAMSNNIVVEIYTDSGGTPPTRPGTLVTGASVPIPASAIPTSYEWVTAIMTANLAASTPYWISVRCEPPGSSWLAVGCGLSAPPTGSDVPGHIAYRPIGGSWSVPFETEYDMFYQVLVTGNHQVIKFCEYKGALYAATSPADGSAGRVLINGDRGVAGTSTATTLVDATKRNTWTAGLWNGCTVKLIGGKGEGQYRTIVDTVIIGSPPTSARLDITPPWDTIPDTTTEYVILGSSRWSLATTTTTPTLAQVITKPITDMIAAGEYLVIAQGNDASVIHYRCHRSGTAFRAVCGHVEDSLPGTLLAAHWMGRETRVYLIGDPNKDGTWELRWCSRVDAQTLWRFSGGRGVNLVAKPTALVVYNNALYVFTPETVYMLVDNTLAKVDINYGSLQDENNGRRATVFNSFLFFPLGYGLQRTSGSTIDDIGPDRDSGIPAGRQGYIADMAATVDNLYCAIDAGWGPNTSSVMCYNSFGWHELCRAVEPGERIRAVYYQVIPGGPNLLWHSEGNQIVSCPMPSKTGNPYKDPKMSYASSGYLITPWIDVGMANTKKFFHELKVNCETPDSSAGMVGDTSILCYYQTDRDGDSSPWKLIPASASRSQIDYHTNTSGLVTMPITAGDTLAGYRIRFKFVLTSTVARSTPRIKAWSLETLSRIDPKYSYGTLVKVVDHAECLDHTTDPNTAAAIMAQLDAWAMSSTPLLMTSVDPNATGLRVFVEPSDYRVSRWEQSATGRRLEYIVSLRLIEA